MPPSLVLQKFRPIISQNPELLPSWGYEILHCAKHSGKLHTTAEQKGKEGAGTGPLAAVEERLLDDVEKVRVRLLLPGARSDVQLECACLSGTLETYADPWSMVIPLAISATPL